jgi:hypothetical protein
MGSLATLLMAACATSVAGSTRSQTQSSPATQPVPSAPASTAPLTYLAATVWTEDPRIPVLVYHRFIPPSRGVSNPTQVLLADFQDELERLYAAGYSLVSLQDWLEGDLSLPASRKPLAITIDDAFFADQVSIDSNGIPLENTGLGILWAFANDHPDFGFKVSLFANYGDKYYNNLPEKDWFQFDLEWRQALGDAIAWCLDHNVGVYNHLYSHPRLDLTKPEYVYSEVARNDVALRFFLTNAGHATEIEKLHNIIGLPYGLWPPTKWGVDSILNYVDPEGKPVEAVFGAGSYTDPGYLSAPYSPGYDPMHIPRINASAMGVAFVIQQAADFPAASSCLLGPLDPSSAQDSARLQQAIQRQVEDLHCPFGVYSMPGGLYEATESRVQEILLSSLP